MYDLRLEQVDGAAMLTVRGPIDTTTVPDFDEALSVLDAEAMIIVNLVGCVNINDDGVGVLQSVDRMRNGRFVIVAASHSQPRMAVETCAKRLQIVSSVREATLLAIEIAETAYRALSNRAGLSPTETPLKLSASHGAGRPQTPSDRRAKRAQFDCMKLIR